MKHSMADILMENLSIESRQEEESKLSSPRYKEESKSDRDFDPWMDNTKK